MTGKLSKNFHGVGIGPLSNILAVKIRDTKKLEGPKGAKTSSSSQKIWNQENCHKSYGAVDKGTHFNITKPKKRGPLDAYKTTIQ